MRWRAVALVCFGMAFLAGCAQQPYRDDGELSREAMQGVGAPVPAPLPSQSGALAKEAAQAADDVAVGTGQFVKPVPLSEPKPRASGPDAVNFNFENQPIQAVVQVVLGEMLKQRYVVMPGVQGNVTFATAEPVDRGQALPILEMLLSWSGNALVRKDGRYVVLPAKEALSGYLAPVLGAPSPRDGLQARLFPLHYIAAAEMQKLLAPFARADAVLLADANRNLLVLAGTSEELTNYQRAIDAFDVNWLRGMSVAVFNLQRSDAGDLMAQLDRLFGPKGDTPLAGMIRFVPLEQSNALVAISAQPAYLEEVRRWIERIDRGTGNQPQVYVYDARNLEAADLADYLNDIYGTGEGGRRQEKGGVGPGLTPVTLGKGSDQASRPVAGSAISGDGAAGGDDGASRHRAGTTTLANGARITAAEAGNQLLVRALPAQWSEIQAALRRLDVTPLQVQVEMRILEVTLTGEFRFGVQWYLQGLSSRSDPNNPRQGALGFGGAKYNAATDGLFYSFVNKDLQVALRAMETGGHTRVLSAPSVIVANKQPAHIQVGSRIPITQNYIDTSGNTNATIGSVQYQDTGVILDVTPRVNPGGLIYLNVGQQVSSVDPATATNALNPTLLQRQVNTHAIVQSGQTVLLGGLIRQDESRSDGGVPLLNRVPVVGRLFGTTNRNSTRTELIVLITPTVIANSEDARRITEEYSRKLKSLAPPESPSINPGNIRVAPASATEPPGAIDRSPPVRLQN